MAEGAVGIVLAAGAGSRFGMPKALARRPDGTPWLAHAATTLADAGCEDVVVVLGAMAEAALHLVPPGAGVVIARGWESGQSASLVAGLEACSSTDAIAAVVTLVDLPDLRPEAARRVASRARAHDLRRAPYAGAPGHPVLVGRAHWGPIVRSVWGDAGAAGYLAMHGAAQVDCTDVGGGRDIDVA
ncbi:MAG: hypothetical protein JWP31_1948 [Aeromicrobium sp.]|nr:hypothetical protein [Aeromicrobium sp.]